MKSIAIIGAGFSGTALAIQLLRRARQPMEILLINRSGPVARGLAYGTHSPLHVLNVPAARMSLFPDIPNDFAEFAATIDKEICGADFVARSIFGCYLETRLHAATAAADANVKFRPISEQVVNIARTAGKTHLTLANERQLVVDEAVLATGNFAPATPASLLDLKGWSGYIPDPWLPGVLTRIPADAPVMLIGTGLTMFDVAISLDAQNHQRPVIALSRRGLLPQSHRDNHHPPPQVELSNSLVNATSITSLCKAVRQYVSVVEERGMDWRDAIAALRPVTSRLWDQLPTADRARFLRHLSPYWDVHRHRAATTISKNIDRLRSSELLLVQAGKIVDANKTESGFLVNYRKRGQIKLSQIEVAYIVNCTGPQSDIRRLSDPLFVNLRTTGQVCADTNGLGLRTNGNYGLLDVHGNTQPSLHVIGPLLKAELFESTAVPELRVHAQDLAIKLLG
ncbi:MAG: FAD/NAD(P)-binding protein [Pseudomonadota bacterium]